MHVLIIPSEEFVPQESHLAGIFQKHQALALKKTGCKVGVLSVRQSLSIPMLIKEIFLRISGKRVNPKLKQRKWGELVTLLFNKSFSIQQFITKENIEGLDVFRIDGFYFVPPGKHSNHFGWLIAGMKLWENYCTVNGTPDVIHAHNAVYAGMLANRISKKKKIPYIITEHSSFVARNLESWFIRNKIKEAYKQSSDFFVVSDFLGKKINEVFQTTFNWKVLSNVLDSEIEEASIPLTNIPNSPFIFISIGSLISLKRHKDLIDAFNLQFSGDEDVQLTIAGDGELKKDLQDQIKRLGLGKQIRLLGRLNRKEVLQLIDNSHCLVLCSEIETFGVVLIEALSRGKPIIATRCGGPESIVNIDNGLLCAVRDVDALSIAMAQMKETYETYNLQQIRHSALAIYGSAPYGKLLQHKYEDVIS